MPDPMSETLDIKILGKDYRVACAPEERRSLEEAVALLSARLNASREKTRSNGEKLAVMVALELAHELVLAPQNSMGAPVDSENLRRSIKSIESRIAAALEPNEKLF